MTLFFHNFVLTSQRSVGAPTGLLFIGCLAGLSVPDLEKGHRDLLRPFHALGESPTFEVAAAFRRRERAHLLFVLVSNAVRR